MYMLHQTYLQLAWKEAAQHRVRPRRKELRSKKDRAHQKFLEEMKMAHSKVAHQNLSSDMSAAGFVEISTAQSQAQKERAVARER